MKDMKDREIVSCNRWRCIEGERKYVQTVKLYQHIQDPFDNWYWKLMYETSGEDAKAVLSMVKALMVEIEA